MNDGVSSHSGIPRSAFPENVPTFSGHFHKPHTVGGRDGFIRYVGSPYQVLRVVCAWVCVSASRVVRTVALYVCMYVCMHMCSCFLVRVLALPVLSFVPLPVGVINMCCGSVVLGIFVFSLQAGFL